MKNAEILLEELEKHADAKEIIKEYGKIETVTDYAGALLFAAKRLGIETTCRVSGIHGSRRERNHGAGGR